jgi:hypothetical protein
LAIQQFCGENTLRAVLEGIALTVDVASDAHAAREVAVGFGEAGRRAFAKLRRETAPFAKSFAVSERAKIRAFSERSSQNRSVLKFPGL